MKLKFGFFLALMIAGVIVANAQGGFRRTVEERVKSVHEKMDSAFKLDSEKQVKVDSAFANYYRQQDKIREEMRRGGERPDFQAMREKMQPAIEARDKELKTFLTDEQFKKWKEEIEPAMMQRRGGNRQ
jgi:biopolymer transport protein ExbB/TolQ